MNTPIEDRNLTLFVYCRFFKDGIACVSGESVDDSKALEMEQIEEDLEAYLERNRSISVFDCLLLMRDAALSLDYLHASSAPIIHGNLIPQNCIISKQGILKIGDVGSAHSNTPNDTSLTKSLSTSQSVCEHFMHFLPILQF